MMTSFYNLLKYAATGQASSSMTYFDKMRASTLMGGAVQTLTDVPPLSFKANGNPLVSWSMLGNGSQSGTPSPASPIQPQFCGVRTANLFDVANLSGVGWATTYPLLLEAINSLPNGVYTMSISYELTARNDTADSSACGWYIAKDTRILSNIRLSWQNAQIGEIMTITDTFTIDDNNRGSFTALYLYGCGINGVGRTGFANAESIMLNSGSTALPYEPYGYKIPLTCAGQTVPVYLGQTQTVRRVKKLVLTGTSTDGNTNINSQGIIYVTPIRTLRNVSSAYCTHYPYVAKSQGASMPMNSFTTIGGAGTSVWFRTEYTSAADFKDYLAAQYAAGTPVTVWYVLETPTTGIVNEPLCKIGDYADELHSTDAGVTIPTAKGQNTLTVETDLQPSEMSITYKG